MTKTDPPTSETPDIEKVLGVGAHKSGARKWWLALVVLVVVAGGLGAAYAMWGRGDGARSVRYITEPATRGNLTVIVTATGSVEPLNKVDVSSELSGTVRRVLVDYNSKVKAGETLAELDTDKLKATVASSRAKLAAARARVKDTEATLVEKQYDYERKKKLVERKVSTDQSLEVSHASYLRALAAVDVAKADVASAEADLALQETNLRKACICSPVNGVVLSRNVDPGQTIASNLQAPVLFTIAEDLSKMQVEVDVDEADVGQVKPGQPATFTVDAYPNKVFSARIRDLRYGSETVQGVVTYKAILETDNSDLLLRPGMTATAEIRVKQIADALSLPNAALRYQPAAEEETDDRSFIRRLLPGRPRFRKSRNIAASGPDRSIWVLADGVPEEVKVTIGATDGKRTEIVKGDIETGAAIIVDTAARGK